MDATRRSRPGRKPRGSPTAAAVVVVLIAAPTLGTAAVLTTATLFTQPAAFLTAGALVTAVTALAGTRRALRAQPAPRRTALTAVTTGALLLVGTIALLTPLVPTQTPRVPVDGAAFWRLDTGSRLAYIHLPATTPVRPVPVVVLHGGPAIPDTAANVAAFGPLTRIGFDVYFYDQLGAGRSARLADPAGYGLDRDVDDLDAVRRTLGVDMMILIGHSYGGALAAHYLATHPDHVQQMVLLSPGPLDPADTSASRATSGLDVPQKMAAYGAVLAPRALLGYALLQVNPAAAHSYFRDSEADARNDTVLTLAAPGCTAPGRLQLR